MKNNKIFVIFIFLLKSILISNTALAEEITFNTQEINITDNGNEIEASDGEAISTEENFTINAEKFFYNKKKLFLIAKNSLSKFKNDNINVESKILTYKKKDQQIDLEKNVKIVDLNNNIIIKSEKIFYDLQKKIIFSNVESQIIDFNKNNYFVKKFRYNLDLKLLKLEDIKFLDINKNQLTSEIAYLDIKKETLAGKDLIINLSESKINPENNPRLKGKSFVYENNKFLVNKGNFTLCKIRNEKCPPWTINAETVTHDNEEKTIYYDKAWLKLYDKPVLYFPKFFHPDPSVKRRSGFLIPSFNSSSSTGSSTQIPYYVVFSERSDMTLTPKIYDHNKALIQTEYREEKKNSSFIADTSLLKDDGNSTKSHIFINQKNNLSLNSFSESELSFRFEKTSHDTYLRSYKIKSPIIKDKETLRNTISFNGNNEDIDLKTEFHVFENLNKTKSDRYEYVYPSYELEKRLNFFNNYNGDVKLISKGSQKKYNTNVDEQIIINDVLFSSFPKINSKGFKTKTNLLLKNTNTNSNNSNKYKSHKDHKILTLTEINSALPLIKRKDTHQEILSPKISLRYSPNETKDIRNSDNRINVSNIFDLNRLTDSETVEGGGSLTYGLDYNHLNKNRTFFESKIANVIRVSENDDLPANSKLGKKTSDIVGSLKLNPNNFLTLEYDFSQDENLKDNNYQFFKSEFKINNLVTSFEYLDEQNTLNKEHYLSNKTSYNFDETKNLSYTTRRNKKTKLTEFYNLVYEYKNDCLKASLEYNKDYYNDRDIKPEESIFFRLTIMPFGQTKGPNLK